MTKRLNSGKKLKKKGALLVAYEENENLHNIFSFSGNFKFLKAGIELYQEKISPKEYLSNLINLDYSPSNRRLLNFTMNLYSNAIEESDIVQLGGLYRPMVGLAFLSGRAFIMTSGQEVPISRSLKLYRYKPIDWQNYLNDDFFRQFILLQKRNKALRYKDVAMQPIETNNENVIGFKKEMDGNVIYGFFNLSFNEQKIILNEGVHGVNHYINNLEINMVKGQEITLPKTQYIILSNV